MVTWPNGMPVRDVYQKGVNINSLIWGRSPNYHHVALPVMQPLAVPVEANLIKKTQQPPTQGYKTMKMSLRPQLE